MDFKLEIDPVPRCRCRPPWVEADPVASSCCLSVCATVSTCTPSTSHLTFQILSVVLTSLASCLHVDAYRGMSDTGKNDNICAWRLAGSLPSRGSAVEIFPDPLDELALTGIGCKMEKAVDERPCADPPAIAVGGATVFLLDHMTSKARGCRDALMLYYMATEWCYDGLYVVCDTTIDSSISLNSPSTSQY